jgi:hypothetical protein
VAGEGVTYTPGADVLFIDTTPEGAEARLDGEVLGSTPFSSNLSCRGDKVRITVKKSGYQSSSVDVACRRGTARVTLIKKNP